MSKPKIDDNDDRKVGSKTNNAGTKIAGIAGTMAVLLMAATITVLIPQAETAEAALVSQNIRTWTLKSEPTNIQLVGSGNYNDWHYVIKSQPANGYIPVYDGVTGDVFYQPNAGFNGAVDKFTYRLEKDNPNWHSATSTVSIAVVEPWSHVYSEKITPVLQADYIKAKGLTPATVNTIPGVDNIDPYKQTEEGKVRYSNVKASWELSGQSWWSLTLGQKLWLMENVPYKAGQWAGVY